MRGIIFIRNKGDNMQDKMKTLLDKIILEDDYYHYFTDAKITKVEVDKTNNTWLFFVEMCDLIPPFIHDHLVQLMVDKFTDVKKIGVIFHVHNKSYDNIKEYFDFIIDHLGKDVLLLEQYKERPLVVEDDTLKLEIYNKVEEVKFRKLIPTIEEKLISYGFSDISFKTEVNHDVKESIQKEIENTKDVKTKEVVKEESCVLLGREIKGKSMSISGIVGEDNNITIECKIFGIELFESSKTSFKIITLKVTDYTDSMYAKVFSKTDEEFADLKSKLKEGMWLKINGYTKNDPYAKAIVLNARDINKIDSKDEKIKDDAEVKRVELHLHTQMSQMDGLIAVPDLISAAKKMGHKAVAITDHSGLQSFPDAFNGSKGFKILYGVELNLIDDETKAVFNESDMPLEGTTYVVFDFETTGLNASGGDSIIEVGAVKLLDGEIIDRFSELIYPERLLPAKITEITGITDDLLIGKRKEEEVIKEFMEWTGICPMVAHNAKFDASFLESAHKKYNMGTYKNVLIDTLELSRMLDPNEARHNLSALVKRYDISFDEDSHHRADYDAEGTAMIFHKMIKKLLNRHIDTVSEIKTVINEEEVFKILRPNHINILVKNNIGLKNLFKIVSMANTKYFHKMPRILRSELVKHREGLLFGSSCAMGEVFEMARSKSDEEVINAMNFYDYIEVQPVEVYSHLIQLGDFETTSALEDHIKKIVRLGKSTTKLVVATGDVHHITRGDKLYRQIIVNQKVPGGGRHILDRKEITSIPSQHYRTTTEMLSDFKFLGEELANEIVVTNTNLIADMIDDKVDIVKDNGGNPFSPKMENSDIETKEIVYKKAYAMYGNPLPKIIGDRLERELNGIINGGFDVIYLIAQKLVKKSNDDGFIVGSRGSVGSSLVATMMDITEVNPLPPHYRCPNCKESVFEEDGKALGAIYSSGFDLPDKICTCGTNMIKDGNDMPFETFLGFNADKVPDIDLNFDGEYQSKAHDYTKVLFGESNVFRAGTIGTVADKTAFGFVKGYTEDKGIMMSTAEIERLAMGCVGVKRTTGQHPGGIIVIPEYMDVYDFTAFQYPADDTSNSWYTTHFDFTAIHDSVLKLDILGHDDPTTIRLLQKLTGVKLEDINFDDRAVLSLFTSPDALGVTKEQIMCETGTLGIPEFGTRFVINMLKDTHPASFGELIKISGLSHGTDVWKNNAELLIQENKCEFKEVIGCRDDIMVYLMYHGLAPLDAFKIMEFVRKGKPSKEPDAWAKWADLMKEKGIVDWYIDSCKKIKYMFPKAHAAAYVMSGFRIAWFKVHYPIEYYAAYFSVRAFDFDLEAMVNGANAIKNKIVEITNKGYGASNKESNTKDILDLTLEMVERGYKFGLVNLYKSDANNFVIDDDHKTLIPPFRAIDGLGNTVAQNIVNERENNKFISIEDLQKRGKVSSTLIDKLRTMGVLKDLPESSQMTLF